MNELNVIEKDGKFLVDSREVAVMIEKQHAHLVRDIDNYIQVLENPILAFGSTIRVTDFFLQHTYQVDSQSRGYKCYLLTKKGCDMVANKMTGEKGVLFTATYVTKFEEMENKLKESAFQLPKTYKEALLALVFEIDAKEIALEQVKLLNGKVDVLEEEIDYKQKLIDEFNNDTDLASKRQRLNQILRRANADFDKRWIYLYKEFQLVHHMDLNYQFDKYNLTHKPKARNKVEYIEKIGMINDLYALAIKIFENDVNRMIEETYNVVYVK